MATQAATAEKEKGNGKANGGAEEIESKPTKLSGKLAAIMAEISRVKKSGRNEHFKYDYVTEADLADAIRPLLAKYGLGLIFSVEDVSDIANNITQVKISYVILDSSTGEREVTTCFGRGQDKNDKGIYKAITGATKYWMYKTFLVSTGDDPENDGEMERPNHDSDKKQPQDGAGNQQPMEDPEQARLRADWERYQLDERHMRTLKSAGEVNEFMRQNGGDINSNSYAGYYIDLANTLRQQFQKAA